MSVTKPHSVFICHQNTGAGPLAIITHCLCDNPDLLILAWKLIGREKPAAIFQGLVIGLQIILAQITPVSLGMPAQEVLR